MIGGPFDPWEGLLEITDADATLVAVVIVIVGAVIGCAYVAFS